MQIKITQKWDGEYPVPVDQVAAVLAEGIAACQTTSGTFRAEALAGWLCSRYNLTKVKPQKVKVI